MIHCRGVLPFRRALLPPNPSHTLPVTDVHFTALKICNFQQQSGAGLVFSKLTVDILRNALGSQVLDLIATERKLKGGIPNFEAAQVEEGIETAAPQKLLVGAKDTNERLKVGASEPSVSRVPHEFIDVTASWRSSTR